ncbi:RidA family protein [Pseudomonas petrae]|uniref:RidA family protein n=1 Tax=Pseudomonas petrae TaxID=2912190 RepID=A0ABS9I8F7_9PSED|nr:RidA family protein [Pseudomonas petrae]MCF7532692.1 RidA family protein [Pseudomonas petrae]MCF7538891.1 RidA family protein [Pseudomonas petrae]MCF7543692.1 RidA family protein [Pseudomonas petrae]MCF7557065.1 RidA family protein [Pseudomonas petrae]
MTQTPAASSFELSNPPGLYDPAPNAYSHLAVVGPNANWLFVAGQGGEDAQGLLSSEFADQAAQAIANVRTALQSRGADIQHIFKLTLLVVDHTEEKLRIWVEHADLAWAGHMKPVCTLIPVPRLALDRMLIEIEAVAALMPRD